MTYISSVSSEVTTYEPVTTSGEVSFSGLGNGTDFMEILETQVAAESFKKEEYEAQLEEQEYVVGLLGDLNDALGELEDLLEDYDTVDEFLSLDVTSSLDEVQAEADGEAADGSHTVIVNQLAASDVWANTSTGFSVTDGVVASSATTLSLTCGGEVLEVDVASGTTLEGLVDQVNAQVGGQVEASLLDDGDEYYFLLSSKETGADNALTITDTGTLTGFAASGFVNTQPGCDAQIKVDGFPPGDGEWISRPENEIDDVIDSMTLTLTGTTDGEAAFISLAYDEESLQENVETFVSEVNQIILDIQTLTGRVETTYTASDGSEQEAPTIQSYALDIMYNDVKSILSSVGLGFVHSDADGGGDTFSSLSQLGLSTDAEEGSDTFGQLLLDEDVLEAAIDEDAYAVARLFAARDVLEADDGLVALSLVSGTTKPGEYAVEYEISGGMLVSATVAGQSAEVDGWNILATNGNAHGLLLTVTDRTDGSYESEARIKQGKIGELYDELEQITAADNGTLTILIESCEDSIEMLEDDIYYEEQRLSQYEAELTRKYAALDAVLASYTQQEASLESLIAQL